MNDTRTQAANTRNEKKYHIELVQIKLSGRFQYWQGIGIEQKCAMLPSSNWGRMNAPSAYFHQCQACLTKINALLIVMRKSPR